LRQNRNREIDGGGVVVSCIAYRKKGASKVENAEHVARFLQVQQEAESLRQGLDRFQDEALLKMRQSLKEVCSNRVEG
jgi:hypothetical protein